MNSTIYNRATMSVALNAREAEALHRFIQDNMITYVQTVRKNREIEDEYWRQKVRVDYNYRECLNHGNYKGADANRKKLDDIEIWLNKYKEAADMTWDAECAARELMKILEPLAAEGRRGAKGEQCVAKEQNDIEIKMPCSFAESARRSFKDYITPDGPAAPYDDCYLYDRDYREDIEESLKNIESRIYEDAMATPDGVDTLMPDLLRSLARTNRANVPTSKAVCDLYYSIAIIMCMISKLEGRI